MGEIGLCSVARLVDYLAQLAAPYAVHEAYGQRNDVVHERGTYVGGDTERRKMRAEQRTYIYKDRQNGEEERRPTVADDMLCTAEMGCHGDDFAQYHPYIYEGQQRHECTQGRQHPRGVSEIPEPSGIREQPLQVRLFVFFFHILYI